MCSCPERPRCEWDYCGADAVYSVWQPRWGSRSERIKFMCAKCFEVYRAPLAGIDRPEWADEYWRPSLSEMMQQASIKKSFAQSRAEPGIDPALIRPGDKLRYTGPQLEQVLLVRRAVHAEKRS